MPTTLLEECFVAFIKQEFIFFNLTEEIFNGKLHFFD